MSGVRSLWEDVKTALAVRLVYPRRFPGCRVESPLPRSVTVGPGAIVKPGVRVTAVLERRSGESVGHLDLVGLGPVFQSLLTVGGRAVNEVSGRSGRR